MLNNVEEQYTENEQGDTIRWSNARAISASNECQSALKELKSIRHFLNDFGFLTSGRDFVRCRHYMFSPQDIFTSLELTMGSIFSCCENACLADANSLLRKYRDDLFFYLYIIAFDANQKRDVPQKKEIAQMENNIIKWIENGLEKLYIVGVLKDILSSAPQLENAVNEYRLKESLKQIGGRLNNFIHANGRAYYNKSVNRYKADELYTELKGLLDDVKYITTAFLFLLILCSPGHVMANDYVDFLDCNMTPRKEAQYWVAPFVGQFIKENITLIDESCLSYLKKNTPMQFE